MTTAVSQHKKILLVTAKRIGDALFLTPGIKLLKKYLPNVQFDVLALGKTAADVFINNPAIHTIHLAKSEYSARKIANQYPLVINLMYEMTEYILKLNTEVLSIGVPDQSKPRAQQVIDFVSQILNVSDSDLDKNYVLYPQKKDQTAIEKLFHELSIDPKQHILIGCQLGCNRVARRGWKFWRNDRHQHKKVWPVANYIDLAKKLCNANKNIRLILTGSESERFLEKLVKKDCPEAISFIGRTNLLELTILMDYLQVLITHDTGTLHVACSRQIPLVTLFGPTPLAFTGPFPMQPQYAIINKSNMAEITVDEVFAAVMEKV